MEAMVYKDPSRPVKERVEDLITRMTLEEKVAQLCGDLPFSVMGAEGFSEEKLRASFPDGHGRFTQISTMGLKSAEDMAALLNKIQHYFVEETRLGIPVAFQSETLCGLPVKGGTIFPAQMNLGYTWEPELAERMAKIISEECRAVGVTSAMSPVIDVSRDLRWGRTYETYGEDPYLISQMGVAYIKGMQKDKTDGVACIAKHFLGYADTQGGLNTAVTRVNDRELYEVFATPFEAAANVADVSGMMANYSEIDGLNVVVNKKIATTLLRDTMKYRGFLTSDGAGIMKCHTDFHVANSYAEAGYLAKKAGTDTEIPVGGAFRQLPEYVRSHALDEGLIDASLRRVLTVKFEYGLFEHPYVDVEKTVGHLGSPSKDALAEEIARKSMVLLKNDGILPLKKDMKLAVIGPHGDQLRYPISGYTYPAYLEMVTSMAHGGASSFNGIADEAKKDDGQDMVTGALGSAAAGGLASLDINDMLWAAGNKSLYQVLSERFQTVYAQGCDITGKDRSGFDEACAAARTADAVVFACGGNCGWTDTTGGEGRDRAGLGLPGVQQALLEAVAGTGRPIILVTYGPGLFSLPWAAEHAAAMVQASMPGLQAGRVVADVLDGTVNPGGKLTQTIPRSVGQTPCNYNHRMGSGYVRVKGDHPEPFGNNIFVGGYTDEDDSPLYEFGYGLSYTTFSVTDGYVGEPQVSTDGCVVAGCTVTNTGDRRGDEVIQLYYHTVGAHVIRPVMQLAGFKRLTLEPGEAKTVEFTVPCSLFAYYNEDMEFVTEPVKVEIMLGTSAHKIDFCQDVQLTGERVNVMGQRAYGSEVVVK